MKRRLADVDAALEAAREDARRATLSPALRARILARASPAAAAPRGRLVDFALRAAAVAAAAAAVLFAAPVELAAAELDPSGLLELNERFAATVTRHVPEIDVDALAVSGGEGAFAAAALGLLVAAAWCARIGARR
jgi:hypothetical protein